MTTKTGCASLKRIVTRTEIARSSGWPLDTTAAQTSSISSLFLESGANYTPDYQGNAQQHPMLVENSRAKGENAFSPSRYQP